MPTSTMHNAENPTPLRGIPMGWGLDRFLWAPKYLTYPMLRNSASGPGIGLPGRILIGKTLRSALRPAFGRPEGPIVKLSQLESGRNPARSPISGSEALLPNTGYHVALSLTS